MRRPAVCVLHSIVNTRCTVLDDTFNEYPIENSEFDRNFDKRGLRRRSWRRSCHRLDRGRLDDGASDEALSCRLEQIGVDVLQVCKMAFVVFQVSRDKGVGLSVAGSSGLFVSADKVAHVCDDLGHQK